MSLSRTTTQATDTANVTHRREAHPLAIRIMHRIGASLVISMMLSGWVIYAPKEAILSRPRRVSLTCSQCQSLAS